MEPVPAVMPSHRVSKTVRLCFLGENSDLLVFDFARRQELTEGHVPNRFIETTIIILGNRFLCLLKIELNVLNKSERKKL